MMAHLLQLLLTSVVVSQVVFQQCCDARDVPVVVTSVTRGASNVRDIAVDRDNNLLYVSDTGFSVYRFASNGASASAQVIAGSGASGATDGVGGAARFSYLYGITCDTANHIAYMSDYGNHRIRTLDLTNNNVTTLAGSSLGFQDGIGVAAQFSGPYGIAHYTSRIDGMVLFVTDTGNYRIRRIVVASASVTTVAQTPYCYYLCISRDGSSLFVTTDLTVVRINTSTGVSVTLAGGTSRGSIDGINATARFNVARGIALNRDETALIVADNNNNLVRRLELSSNNVSTIAGSTTSGLMDGPGLAARFYFPFGGNWYCNKTSLLCGLLVADRDNGAIRFVAVELTNEATSSSSILMSPTRSFSTTTSFDSKSSTMPLSTSLSVSQSVTDASGSITGSCSSRFTRSFSGSPSTTQSGTALSGNMTLSLSISNSESFLVLTSRSQKSLSNSDTKLSSDVASSSFSGSCSKTQSLSSLSLTSRTVILFSETFTLANQMKAQRPSDTVVGAVSATAAIGALGGDPSSSISLVMLALLTCSHDPPVSVATYFVSLFFGLGNVAMALGNIGLAMGVLLLHFFGALILAKVSPSALVRAVDGPAPRGAFDRFLPVASMCYFPSQSVKVLIMLLPGSVLGGVAGTIRGVSGGDVAACIVALVLGVTLFSGLVLVQQRIVLPRSEYVRYHQYSVGYDVEKTVLFPSARWEPRHMRQSFQPLLTAVAEGYSPLIFSDLFLACFIGIVSGSYVGGACDTPLLAIAAALYFLLCIVFSVLRPHRLPMDRVYVPLNYLLMGCICTIKYSDPTNSASSTIQMIVSGLQIWGTGWSVFVTMYREPQLRDDDEPHNTLHSTIQQAQEKEALYGDNIEFGGNDEELFPLHHHDDVVVGVEDAMNVVDAKIKCDDDGGALEGGLFWDADGNARTQPRGGRPITYERNNESDTALHFAFQVNDSDRDYDGDDKRLKYV